MLRVLPNTSNLSGNKSLFNSFCSNVAKQVARFCCPFRRSLTITWICVKFPWDLPLLGKQYQLKRTIMPMMQSLVLFSGPVHTYPDIWIRNFFFPNTAIVHTYLVNPAYDSAAFWIGSSERKFLNMLWIRIIVWTLNSDIFLSGDVTRLSPVLYRSWQPRSQVLSPTRRCKLQDVIFAHFTTHALLPIFPEILCTRVNPDTYRIRVDGKIRFEYWYEQTWKFLNPEIKKKLRIQKFPDACERGLSLSCVFLKILHYYR